jgi:hypothetical protein
VDTNATDLWVKRLPDLLEGHDAWNTYNADETGLFFNCLPDRMLALKGDLPWKKKCEGATHGATVHKQIWLRQMSTQRYWKSHETTVFKKCNGSYL